MIGLAITILVIAGVLVALSGFFGREMRGDPSDLASRSGVHGARNPHRTNAGTGGGTGPPRP
jgi:hypothetical protein